MTDRIISLSERITDEATSLLEVRTSRAGLLRRFAVFGSAMTIAPLRYLLQPESAWAVTTCTSCSSGLCHSSPNSTFCCTIYGGDNQCPPGSGECGYWYCSANQLFYLDCCANTACTGKCALDNCSNRKTCCNPRFYFNCSGFGSGKVVCRVTTLALPGGSCTYVCSNSYGTGNCDSPPPCAANPLC